MSVGVGRMKFEFPGAIFDEWNNEKYVFVKYYALICIIRKQGNILIVYLRHS